MALLKGLGLHVHAIAERQLWLGIAAHAWGMFGALSSSRLELLLLVSLEGYKGAVNAAELACLHSSSV